MADLALRHIDKIYDNNVQAVFDFNLEIKDKEFIVLVGPSGCGKSTTLRMVAGLEEISRGELLIDGVLMNNVEPKDRDIAMVFQSYALYPHMTVFDNMAFALRIRKLDPAEIKRRVTEAARILEIEQYLDRKPKALSGGQRQRVALGRAIVRHAKVFLMDEPLSNLDAKLRVQMRSEIIRLHERIGATTIYVTHDQTEAMTMADRIVIMRDGYVMQVGSAKEIYNNPANVFVAGFVGAPACNFLEAKVERGKLILGETELTLPEQSAAKLAAFAGQELLFGIRPEEILPAAEAGEGLLLQDGRISFPMLVDVCELLGHEYILHGSLGAQKLIGKSSANYNIRHNECLRMSFPLDKAYYFAKDSGQRLL